jgi:hypothetical protein
MDFEIKMLDEVWTSDDRPLGFAQRLYHRRGKIDPDLLLFASYLLVANYQFGDDYYVPTDFIAGPHPASGRIVLTVTSAEVLRRSWSRQPAFIAFNDALEEPLPRERLAAPAPGAG